MPFTSSEGLKEYLEYTFENYKKLQEKKKKRGLKSFERLFLHRVLGFSVLGGGYAAVFYPNVNILSYRNLST